MPQCGDVGRECANGLSLVFRQRRGALGAVSPIVLLEGELRDQMLFELTLDRARHQSILRLDGVVLAATPVDRVLRALQPLLPQHLHPRALGVEVRGDREADLDRGRLQRAQQQCRHRRIDTSSGE